MVALNAFVFDAADDLDAAETFILQGHRLLDSNGWLYLEQAPLEMARGHPERASRIFEQYRNTLSEDADETAGTVATPPQESNSYSTNWPILPGGDRPDGG